MNKLKGLTKGYKIVDIEKFCRGNWEYIHKKQEEVVSDYTDGLKQAFREIIDGYFGGL